MLVASLQRCTCINRLAAGRPAERQTLLQPTHPDACEVVHTKGEVHIAGSHCRGAPSASATGDMVRGTGVWRHVLNQAQQPATEQQAPLSDSRHMCFEVFIRAALARLSKAV